MCVYAHGIRETYVGFGEIGIARFYLRYHISIIPNFLPDVINITFINMNHELSALSADLKWELNWVIYNPDFNLIAYS